MRTFDLDQKSVLITGASSGIGAAAAQCFARAGARLTLAARRLPRVEALAAEIRARGGVAQAVACDVRLDEQVQRAVERACTAFGGLDVAIANAGIGLYGPVADLTPERLHENFETNVYGALRTIRASLPALRARGGGQLVLVSSVLGHRALPGMGGYCASKFALNALAEALRIEVRKERVDVIVVSPGVTETEFRESALTTSGKRESRAPFGAMPAEAVAEAMVSACRRRKREVLLTWSGRAMVLANRVSPGLFDQAAARMVGPTAT